MNTISNITKSNTKPRQSRFETVRAVRGQTQTLSIQEIYWDRSSLAVETRILGTDSMNIYLEFKTFAELLKNLARYTDVHKHLSDKKQLKNTLIDCTLSIKFNDSLTNGIIENDKTVDISVHKKADKLSVFEPKHITDSSIRDYVYNRDSDENNILQTTIRKVNQTPEGIEILVDEYGLHCIKWELNYSNGFTERENQFLQNTGGDNIEVLDGSTVYIINKNRAPESFNNGLTDTTNQWILLSRNGMKSLIKSESSKISISQSISLLQLTPLFILPIIFTVMKNLLQVENSILANALTPISAFMLFLGLTKLGLLVLSHMSQSNTNK